MFIASYERPGEAGVRDVYAYRDGEPLSCGKIVVRWDEIVGMAGELLVEPHAPHGTARALIAEAARILSEAGVAGVLVHTTGENRTRRSYARLGLRDVPEVPGLKAARVADVRARLSRRKIASG